MPDQSQDEQEKPLGAADEVLDSAKEQVDQVGDNIVDAGHEAADIVKDGLLGALDSAMQGTVKLSEPDIRPTDTVVSSSHEQMVTLVEHAPSAPVPNGQITMQNQLEQAKKQEAQLGKGN